MTSIWKVSAQTCIKKKERPILTRKRWKEGKGRGARKGSWKILIFLMMSSSMYGSQGPNKVNKTSLLKIKIKMARLISMHLTLKFNSI